MTGSRINHTVCIKSIHFPL